jgi:hypothetical protein
MSEHLQFLEQAMSTGWIVHKSKPTNARCDLRATLCGGKVGEKEYQWVDRTQPGPIGDSVYACQPCLKVTFRIKAGNEPKDAAYVSDIPSTSKTRLLKDMLKNTPEKVVAEPPHDPIKKLQKACRVKVPQKPSEDMWRGEGGWEPHYEEECAQARQQVIANVQIKVHRMPTCYKCHEALELQVIKYATEGYYVPNWTCKKGC